MTIELLMIDLCMALTVGSLAGRGRISKAHRTMRGEIIRVN